jgi:hypothetical protein
MAADVMLRAGVAPWCCKTAGPMTSQKSQAGWPHVAANRLQAKRLDENVSASQGARVCECERRRARAGASASEG